MLSVAGSIIYLARVEVAVVDLEITVDVVDNSLDCTVINNIDLDAEVLA